MPAPADDYEFWDVIVAGSGAGGLAAACVAASEGCSVLLLEQSSQLGGTTAISRGMVWAPGNHKMAEGLRKTDLDSAREYLRCTVPGADRTRLDAFVGSAGEALASVTGQLMFSSRDRI